MGGQLYSLTNSTGVTWKHITNGNDEPSLVLVNQKLWAGGWGGDSNPFFHKPSKGFSWRTPGMVKRPPSLNAEVLNSNPQLCLFGK